jgi:hypothetical protein
MQPQRNVVAEKIKDLATHTDAIEPWPCRNCSAPVMIALLRMDLTKDFQMILLFEGKDGT